MFFAKNKYLFLVNKNSVEVFNQRGQSVARLEFPKEVVNFLEIIESEKFDELFKELLKKLRVLNGQALVVVSSDFSYEKTISKEVKDTVLEMKAFVASLPFVVNKIVHLEFNTEEGVAMVVVNDVIPYRIRDLLSNNKWKVVGIMPAVVVLESDQITKHEVSKLWKNRKSLQQFNILQTVNLDRELSSFKVKSQKKRPVRAAIMFVILLVITAVTLLMQSNIFIPASKGENEVVASPLPSPSPETMGVSIENTSLLDEELKGLKVQINNGSGVAGQAANTKMMLQELGIGEITLGDLVGGRRVETRVRFLNKVSREAVELIVLSLEEVYATVSAEISDEEEDGVEVLINTGKIQVN